jgi:hypothetical protein
VAVIAFVVVMIPVPAHHLSSSGIVMAVSDRRQPGGRFGAKYARFRLASFAGQRATLARTSDECISDLVFFLNAAAFGSGRTYAKILGRPTEPVRYAVVNRESSPVLVRDAVRAEDGHTKATPIIILRRVQPYADNHERGPRSDLFK